MNTKDKIKPGIYWDCTEEQAVSLAEKIFSEAIMPQALSVLAPNDEKVQAAMNRGETYSDKYFNATPMLFSNENNGWISKIKNLKKVLTIAGSGDQIIDFVLNGAKNVTGMDINVFQFPVVVLKLMLVNTGEYDLFERTLLDPHSKDCLTMSMIKRVLRNNNSQAVNATLAFWERLFELSEPQAIAAGISSQEYVRRNFVMGESCFLDHGSDRITSYEYKKSRNSFKKCKGFLKGVTINLIEGDVLKVQGNEKYNLVHLSNIHDFMDDYTEKVAKSLHQVCEKNASVSTYFIQVPTELVNCYDVNEAKRIINCITRRTSYEVHMAGTISAVDAWRDIRKIAEQNFDTLQVYGLESGRGYSVLYSYPFDMIMVYQVK